jgi:uncharacterized protein (TIGR00369 family)
LTDFLVADPQFRQRVRDDFGRQKVMQTMGITIESVEPGEVRLQVPFRDDLTQQNGYLHAGVLSTALDTACGFSAYTLMSTDSSVLTIENKINLLRPAQNGPFSVVANVIKPGKTVVVSEGKLFDNDGKLVATMSATNMAVPLRPVD